MEVKQGKLGGSLMKYIEKLTGCALLAITISAHAGLWSTTIHSRANCFNNESITWWAWAS